MSILERVNRAITSLHFPREDRKNILRQLEDIVDRLSFLPSRRARNLHLDDRLTASLTSILTHVHSSNDIVRGLETPEYIWRQLDCFYALAQTYGQLTSIEHKVSIDGNGNPIPWYTYPAIEFLANLDFSEKKIFEYGSGNSTIWWANRCKEIVAVESDRDWFERVNSMRSHTAFRDYRLCEDLDSYVCHQDMGNYNVVVIDGTFRVCCAGFFLSKLCEENNFELLIFDNSDWQPQVIKILNSKLPGWVQVDFHGFSPINNFTATTTIFLNGKTKQDYARDITSLSASKHDGGSVEQFKDNLYVSKYLLK